MRRNTTKFLLLVASSGILLQIGNCLLGFALDSLYSNTLGFVFDQLRNSP